MFKHNKAADQHEVHEETKKSDVPTVAQKIGVPELKPTAENKPAAPVAPDDLRALIEKNLKWSQIIYEQNRKINHKLFWIAAAGWMRFLIIAIPLVLAIWLLPPFIKQMTATYGSILNDAQNGKLSTTSLQEMIQMLPINPAQKEQVKNFLK